LLTRPVEAERRSAAAAVRQWRSVLGGMGLLPDDPPLDSMAMTAALYGFLARTPARLIGVCLADATGDRRPANVPGTSTEYPNWQLPITDSAGAPVLLDDLPAQPGARALARAVTG
jgi:4-alpha-glucanotransferase